ncbi:CU044_5270 family protein [Actinocorallia aurantiaca]|uniref:CU044_5270 family protein n=1 Tax=Actinocorallia aurantiaca TaxID=46204 RepID=A0ABN3U620_9ACTN
MAEPGSKENDKGQAEARARLLEHAGTARRRGFRPGRAGWAGVGAVCVAAAVALTLVIGTGDDDGGDDAARVAQPQRTANAALLAAADATERRSAEAGRYLHTTSRESRLMSAGTRAPSFLVVRKRLADRWQAADPSSDGNRVWIKRLGIRPQTAADRKAWKAAGSPAAVAALSPDGTPRVVLKGVGTWQRSGTAEGATGKAGTLGGRNVTADQLNALPTDTSGLRTALMARYEGESGAEQNQWLFAVTRDLLDGSLPVHPDVQAAAYRMLAELEGVELLGPVQDPDGRRGTGIALDETGGEFGSVRHTLIIDGETGRLLSADEVLLEPAQAYAGIPAGTVRTSTVYESQEWTDERPAAPRS